MGTTEPNCTCHHTLLQNTPFSPQPMEQLPVAESTHTRVSTARFHNLTSLITRFFSCGAFSCWYGLLNVKELESSSMACG